MKKLIVLSMLIACHAVSASPYMSGAVGITRSSIDTLGLPADKTGVGYKLIAGYKFTERFALEAGFFDRGEVEVRYNDPADDNFGLNTEIKTTAFGAAIAYHHKFSEKWSFSARAGAVDVKVKVTNSFMNESTSDSDHHIEPYGGLELSYRYTPEISVDAGWEITKAQYNNEFTENSFNVNMVSLGATWHF